MAGHGDYDTGYNYTIDQYSNIQQHQQHDQPVFPMNFTHTRDFMTTPFHALNHAGVDAATDQIPDRNNIGYLSQFSNETGCSNDNSVTDNTEIDTYPGITNNIEAHTYLKAEIPDIHSHGKEESTGNEAGDADIESEDVEINNENDERKDIDSVIDEDVPETEEQLANSNTETKENNATDLIAIKVEVKEEGENLSDYDSDSTIIDEYEKNESETELDDGNNKKRGRKKQASSGKKEFKCEVCDRILTSSRALEKHGNLHTGKYTCEICGKFCNSQASLDTHAKIHQGFIGTEVCKVCDKNFYDKSSLNKHTLSVHMGIKNFNCEYCDRSFYARKTYVEHVRVHTGERPFKCDQCPKSYKRVADLNHHVRLHKGEVSHTCEFCGEGFRRTSELKRHMQKHSDIQVPAKPQQQFACEYCGVQFTSINRLRNHSAIHIESFEAPIVDKFKTERFIMADTQRLVDNIVQGLGTEIYSQTHGNQNNSKSSSSGFGSKDIHAEDLTLKNEMAVRNNVFGFPSFGTTQVPTAAEGDENPMEKHCSSALEANVEPKDVMEMATKAQDKTHVNQVHNNGAAKRKNDTLKNDDLSEDDIENDAENDGTLRKDEISTGKESKKDYLEGNKIEIKIEIDCDEINDDYCEDENDGFDYEGSAAVAGDDSGSATELEDYSDFGKEDNVDNDSDYEVHKVTVNKRKRKIPSKVTKVAVNKKKKKDTKAAIKVHLKKKRTDKSEEPSSYVCDECGKQFSRKDCFNKHKNIHTGVYKCEICNKSFASQASLDTHMDNHEGKKQKTAACKVCDKVFYDSSSMNKHVKNVHMNFRPFACTDCDRRFSERKTLVEHIRVHTGERPFGCELCSQTFKRQGELNFHIKKHTGETKLTCSECGEGFRRPSELKYHTIMKHTGDRPHTCQICGKGFMSNCMLQEHLLIHSSEKNFECKKCGKGFYSLGKLNRHHRIKSDCQKRPEKVDGVYKCKYCFLEFLDVSRLKTHSKEFHEGEGVVKRYSCHVCYKDFGRQQALKRHLKIHSQTRDYKCSTCDAAFIQKHHLSQHERTHTGEKPFQCKICLKCFAQSSTLYSHMKHH